MSEAKTDVSVPSFLLGVVSSFGILVSCVLIVKVWVFLATWVWGWGWWW